MWARVVELLIAIWLAISPFIFHYPSDKMSFWMNDFICAFLIALFASLSFWRPLKRIHLLTLLVVFWLWGRGYIGFPNASLPWQENSVVIALLLFMLAIVPSHSHHLSDSWQKFLKDK